MKRNIIKEDLDEVFSRCIPWEQLDGKTVLITGAYGMLASYMVFMLLYLKIEKEMDIDIIAIIRSKEKFLKRYGDFSRYMIVYESNLETEISIEENVNYIIHAASLASPQFYGECPIEVLKPNVVGNYYLLKLAEKKCVEGYLLFSTGDIYGVIKNSDISKIKETDMGIMDPLDLHNCYSESKRMAETMCTAWFYQKCVPVKIARIWHTYAPTMDVVNDPRVFASFVKDIINHKDIVMKSDGSAKRSFCYIADAIAGYFLILLCGIHGEAYNVCNSQEFYSIAELAQIMVQLYPELGLKVVKRKREKEDKYIENSVANYIPPDDNKLRELGWKPVYSVTTGFKRVIESLTDND